jgi:hypothetical protein
MRLKGSLPLILQPLFFCLKQVKEEKMLWMDPVTKTWGEGDLYTIDPIHYVDVIQAEIEEAIEEGDEEKLFSLMMQYGRKVK